MREVIAIHLDLSDNLADAVNYRHTFLESPRARKAWDLGKRSGKSSY